MYRLLSLLLFAGFLAPPPVWGAEIGPSQIADALGRVRSTHGANEERDAGPDLTSVKHLLRAWIETELPAEPTPSGPDQPVYLPDSRDYAKLSERLNKVLYDAQLTCGDISSAAYRCPDTEPGWEDARGYLGEVHVSSLDNDRYIVVVTAVGIRCGYDESAYIYSRGPDKKWRLLLQSEQDIYDEHDYSPQSFLSIEVSPSSVAWNEPAPLPLVLTLGYSPWCSSNWQSLFTRLGRTSESTPTPSAIIDRNDILYTGNDQMASARLTQSDVLIEYQGQSIDESALDRPHVEHYLVRAHDKLERTAPFALNPNDFVDEWLTMSWRQASHLTDKRADATVSKRTHATLKATSGDFDSPAKRCRADPTMWQIGFSPEGPTKNNKSGSKSFFLVRWEPPYRFALVKIRHRPFAGCNVTVTTPDDIGTLFPIQGWTR